MSSTRPAPQQNNNNDNANDDDRSTKSANSTVSDFLRKLNPLNQLSAYLPKGASDLFGVAGAATGAEAAKTCIDPNNTNQKTSSGLICPLSSNKNVSDDVDMMLFDAVPFNGDTDRGASSYTSSKGPEFMDMNINIPIKRFGSNLSNISPIGNVSSRVPFDEDDYESDDDLDRILGTMKAGLEKQLYPEVRQQLEERQKQQHNLGKDCLNTTMPTLLSGSSLDSDTENEAAALGDLLFEQPRDNNDAGGDNTSNNNHNYELDEATDTPSELAAKKALAWPMERSIEISRRFQTDSPKKQRFRSRTLWLVAICLVLLVILAIMLGVTLPSMGGRQDQTTAAAASSQAAADVSETETTTNGNGLAPTPVPTNGKPSLLRPSVGQKPRPSLPPELILPADEIVTTNPTSSPSSAPSKSATTIEEQDEQGEDEGRVSSRLPQVRLDMGPMVGHTTFESVTLWAYYTKPAIYLFEEDYKLEVMLYDSDGWLSTLDEAEPDPNRSDAVFATLTNLEPSRVYRYEMRIMDQVVGSGSFQTAPPPLPLDETAHIQFNANDGGTKFEYLLTSCMDRSEYSTQKAWDAISKTDGAKEYPDFAILAGDTIYLQEGIDVDDWWGVRFDRYWFRSERQRAEPHFADFVSNTPIYSVWNNHDYGSSVADMEQPGKEDSLLAWRSLWPNPDYAGMTNSRNTDGIYYSFYWGDVHFIVTDDHWNRNPFTQNRWGRQQTKWIQDQLINSKGVFKIIVLGSDINERDWQSDLENIAPTVAEHSINGVMFNAGDIHRNEYKRVQTGGFPYPVTQITSSGIAKVWRQPFAKIAVDTTLSDPSITVRFFGATSMDEDTTWKNDPNLVCSRVEGEDREKEHSCTEIIRLSDLTIGAKM